MSKHDQHNVAADLAATLVRAFAAVDELLQAQYDTPWATPDVVAERLQATLASRVQPMVDAFGAEAIRDVNGMLEEAVESLGRGKQLDPWDVLAFRGPR